MERKYYYAEFHLVGLKSKGSPEIYGKNYVLTTSEEKAKEKIISYYGFGKKNQIHISEITNLDEDTLIKIHNSNIKLLDGSSLNKEAREKKREYNRERMKRQDIKEKVKEKTRSFTIVFLKENDAKIIEKLEKEKNRVNYLRQLIKKDIENTK